MNKNIQITKTDSSNNTVSKNQDPMAVRKRAMTKLFSNFEKPSNNFDEKAAFDELLDYSKNYNRILYSTISTIIYKNNSKESNQINGDIISNLETLIVYVEDNSENLENKNSNYSKENILLAKKAAWKIWDHVNLANQQFTSLGETDEDFKRRFKKSIKDSTNNLMKNMNAQLLSMVGIFTALAFLLFGGISSLESVFRNATHMPILALSIISMMWVLGLLNVIFVFLYCIGRMTKLNLKATDKENANFREQYPVICWVDFWMILLLCFLSWTYLLYNHEAFIEWYESIDLHPLLWGIGGYVIIIIISAFVFRRIRRKKQNK